MNVLKIREHFPCQSTDIGCSSHCSVEAAGSANCTVVVLSSSSSSSRGPWTPVAVATGMYTAGVCQLGCSPHQLAQ